MIGDRNEKKNSFLLVNKQVIFAGKKEKNSCHDGADGCVEKSETRPREHGKAMKACSAKILYTVEQRARPYDMYPAAIVPSHHHQTRGARVE